VARLPQLVAVQRSTFTDTRYVTKVTHPGGCLDMGIPMFAHPHMRGGGGNQRRGAQVSPPRPAGERSPATTHRSTITPIHEYRFENARGPNLRGSAPRSTRCNRDR
jgi:hypothetical protein